MVDTLSARSLITAAGDALLDERRQLTLEELAQLAALPDEAVPSLAGVAHEVRLEWCGPEVEVEGILSAKTGGCPEDCHFCSQSAQFDTQIQATPFLDTDEVLAAAEQTAALGASEFCIVLAVRGPDERTMARLIELAPLVTERTGLNVAVSAGILTDEQAGRLAGAGVHRYNHNLETARSYFPSIVTTHTWDERFATCELVARPRHGAVLRGAAGHGRVGRPTHRADRPAARRRPGRGAAQLPEPPAGHAAGRPHGGGPARGAALDRPVPPGPAVGHPALRRRARGHPARAAGHGHDRRASTP